MRTLTIRLLRPGRLPANAFSESFAPGAERALQARPWGAIEGASLHVGQIYTKPPEWRGFLTALSPDLPEDLFSSGAGAVIFLPTNGRTFAVCFGHVHIALNDDAFERQFGLKVTLNSVPRSQLRTLDLATPDAVTFQKRVQASKDSDLQAFGVDMLRDLARVAGGTPRDIGFAKFVAGKDSLSITCDVDANGIARKCSEILLMYQNNNYQREFSWIDNMRVVREHDVLMALDAALFEALSELRAGRHTELHLAPPEIINYTEGSELHYNGFGSSGVTFTSLSIGEYVAELNRCSFSGSIDDIKAKHRVAARAFPDDPFSEKWTLYDCFVFETSLGTGGDEKAFVLFAGEWYCVERGFKARVEAFFNSLEKVRIVGATTCKNEEDLIDDLENTRDDLLKLDRQKINPAGLKYANLEPCDFFSRNREFIHLKDGHSSGPISHLWSQGLVSAEALVSDAEFRKKLRAKVRGLGGGFETQLPRSNERLVRESYKVVFGIMRKPYTDGTLGLPFFSKVSLQAAAERIGQFGIPVAIELIQKSGPHEDEADE